MKKQRPMWIHCICRGELNLTRKAVKHATPFITYFGVCSCGRGVHLTFERKPASERNP